MGVIADAATWWLGHIGAALIQTEIVDPVNDAVADLQLAAARCQLVQIGSGQTITHGGASYTGLTNMSAASGNGGENTITTLTLASGILTMLTGSAGRYRLSGRVSMSAPSGITAIGGGILQNGNVATATVVAANTGGTTSAPIPAQTFDIDDGDTLQLAAYVSGSVNGTSIVTAGFSSHMLLERLP